MFGDFGAPTGQTPLYSANDVMIGGIAGGDIMKGFNGDDIMLGRGSFTKFNGGLGTTGRPMSRLPMASMRT